MCDGSGATSWAHDAAGRIITEKRTIVGTTNVTQTLSYSYNLDGSIATVTYPSAKVITYTVGNAQRLTAAKDVANNIQYAILANYSPPGGLNGMITGQISGGFGGITESHTYNSSLEYTSTQATSTAGTALNLSLCYNQFSFASGCSTSATNDNGTVTGITNNVSTETGRTQSLAYDPLNRVSSATTQATSGVDCWGQNFTPDPLANLNTISSAQCSSSPLSVTVDPNNHINSDPTFAYDAAGNMTKDGKATGYSYSFDGENRLVQATGMTGGPYCYVYDGNGLRVAKKSNSNSTCTTGTFTKLYWRSLSGDALAETDGSGNLANSSYNEYVFFAGRRVASRNGTGAIFYWFADQLGSTRTITTGSGTGQTPGQLCYDADFTPYGQEISYTGRLQTSACAPSYKFTGYERDPETAYGATDTGLDYAFARYYSSRLGRFLSTDPLGGSIGDLQSHNAYAYVVNNPTNGTDPSGLCGPLGPTSGGAHTPCPDPDRPGYGPCGLDCAMGGGGGGGGYGGLCPAEFQTCVDNGHGGFVGMVGSGFGYGCNPGSITNPEAPWAPDCDEEVTLYRFAPGGNPLGELKDGVRALFKNAACAALFGDEKNALKQLDNAWIYPPGSFGPAIPASIPAYNILKDHPHGAVFIDSKIFLGPKFFDQAMGAQETILIHELRHQAYNTGEPPMNSPAYPTHRDKEEHGIVAACGTQIPTKQ